MDRSSYLEQLISDFNSSISMGGASWDDADDEDAHPVPIHVSGQWQAQAIALFAFWQLNEQQLRLGSALRQEGSVLLAKFGCWNRVRRSQLGQNGWKSNGKKAREKGFDNDSKSQIISMS